MNLREHGVRVLAIGCGLGVSLAQASPTRDATSVCFDIDERIEDVNTDPAQIAIWIDKDARTYDERVAECLCAIQAPLSVQNAARRKYLASQWDGANELVHRLFLNELSWSQEQHLAFLLGHQIRQDLTPVPSFRILPVHIDLPRDIDRSKFFALISQEFADAQLISEDEWIGQPPRGRLQELMDEGTTDTSSPSIRGLRGTTDAVLWLDVTHAEDGSSIEMSWALRSVPPGRTDDPVPLSTRSVSVLRTEGELVPGCATLPGSKVQRWRTALGAHTLQKQSRVNVLTAPGVILGVIAGGGTPLVDYADDSLLMAAAEPWTVGGLSYRETAFGQDIWTTPAPFVRIGIEAALQLPGVRIGGHVAIRPFVTGSDPVSTSTAPDGQTVERYPGSAADFGASLLFGARNPVVGGWVGGFIEWQTRSGRAELGDEVRAFTSNRGVVGAQLTFDRDISRWLGLGIDFRTGVLSFPSLNASFPSDLMGPEPSGLNLMIQADASLRLMIRLK